MPNRISAELAESPKALPSSNTEFELLASYSIWRYRTKCFLRFFVQYFAIATHSCMISGCDREVYHVFRRKKTLWADRRQHAFHQYTAQFF